MFNYKTVYYMYNTIVNPKTGRSVNRHGNIGQQLLNHQTQYGTGSIQKTNPWINSVMGARTELNITGFQAVKKGTPVV